MLKGSWQGHHLARVTVGAANLPGAEHSGEGAGEEGHWIFLLHITAEVIGASKQEDGSAPVPEREGLPPTTASHSHCSPFTELNSVCRREMLTKGLVPLPWKRFTNGGFRAKRQ